MTLRQPLVALIVVVAALLVAGSFAGVTYCYFYDAEIGGLNSLTAWTSSSWTTTTTAEFNVGVPVRVTTTGDEVKLNMTAVGGTSAQVYALGGGGTTMFWRYDVGADTWTTLASTLAPVSAGGALIVDGGDTLFALAGGGTRTFMMYTVSTNTWVSRANAPSNVGPGGALTYVYTNNYAYAFAGGGTTTFMRYSPATNSWATMASTPVPINGGGSLTWTGGDYIYGLAGGETTTFLRYTISTNSWDPMPPIPLPVAVGGSITYEGGSKLYAITGGGGTGKRDVYQYDITAMTWTQMRDTQNPVNDGAAVTWDGGPYLFVTRGGGQNTFWKYTIATDTWGNARNTPGNVGPGGSLSYVPGVPAGASCYNSPGSIASVVFDTSSADTRWDLLSWNASVPSGTAITIEVRSSNTLFLVDDLAIPWVTVTGTSQGGTRYTVPYSSLPPGRYHQWRATLSSNDCGSTPVLHDATVYFSSGISLITAMGGALSAMTDMVMDFSTYRGVTIANPPFDPYTGAPSALEPAQAPLEPPAAAEVTANATPEPLAPDATATATPTANTTFNATPTATPTVPASASVNVTPTATPNTTLESVQVQGMYETPAPLVLNATATLPNATVTVGVEATVPPTPDATITTPTAEETPAPLVTATETPAPPTAWEVAAGDRNLTTFVRLAREAGLDLLLDGTDPCTVFAPTDDAFRAMPPGYLADLSADPDRLARTLNRHVAPNAIREAELASMPLVVMLDGTEVAVTVEDGSTAVGNATVNYTDTRAANCVVYAIDAVIPPAETPIPTPVALEPSASATPAVTVETTAPTPPVPSETVTVPVTPAVTVETTAPMPPVPSETVTVPATTTETARVTPPWAKSRLDEAG